jgi:hypothetical protein
LTSINLDGNPLEPELDAVYKQGIETLRQFLLAKANNSTVKQQFSHE